MAKIIVYYSLSRNTEYVAQRIAEKTSADLLRLVPVKEYPKSGLKKFFRGGKSAVMSETPELEPYSFIVEKYDEIIFGFPVWAGTFAPPVRAFIKENDLKEKKFSAFACQSGAGGQNALAKLRQELGISAFEAELILNDPKQKADSRKEEKIDEFCSLIHM